jgi:hypothetical protein
MARLFTIASDESLMRLVDSARERLVIVAPGLSEHVGKALLARVQRDGGPRILAVILDTDPEVCRLGFGDLAGLEATIAALALRQRALHTQQGVRIGLVVADGEVVVFTPTPRLIEAGSTSEQKPNAIRITDQSATALALACGAGGSDELILQQEVGLTVVKPKEMEALKSDLKENPPRRFDLARIERVFNYKLEFVDFSVEHYKLQTRSVPLPSELLGLLDGRLQARLRNNFRVFETDRAFEFSLPDPAEPKAKLKVSEKWLSDEADRLRKDYFIPLGSGSYGNLILKRLKPEFEAGVERLRKLVGSYAEKTKASIADKIQGTRDDLIKELFPRIKAAPPPKWLKRSVDGKLSAVELRQRLESEVDKAFTQVEQGFDPKVVCIFKGVNYETITGDQHFRSKISAYFGAEDAAKLLAEYDATRAHPTAST